MIISHRYKFIFIKTRKTAGTSIEVFLSQWCGPDDVVTPIHPHVEPHVARNYRDPWIPSAELDKSKTVDYMDHFRDPDARGEFYNHMPAHDIQQRIPPRIWNSYYKFCVERNPWDKTLSHYYMLAAPPNIKVESMEEYFSKRLFCVDHPRYLNAGGHPMIDRIISYEALTDGLQEVFDHLGIPFEGTLGVQAKSEYQKGKPRYRDVFTEAQRVTVEEVFAREIKMFGYEF